MLHSILSYIRHGISIGTLPPSLRAMAVAGVFNSKKCSILWIVQDIDEMYRTLDDLSLFVDAKDVCGFIPYDIRPYQDDSPSKGVLSQRISVLYRLLQKEPLVVVAPIDAIAVSTTGRQDFMNSIIELKVNTELNRDKFAKRLVCMGYASSPLIDDIGQFSIRGFVMDIYSPGMKSPIRLDMFGDVIERIREFDISTQRSKHELSYVNVLPCSEVLLDKDHIKQARPRLKRLKDPNAKFIIHDIEQKIHIPGIETYIPFFYESPSSIFDYIPGDTIVVSPDDKAMESLWNNLYQVFSQAYQKSVSNGRCLPGPEEIMVNSDIFARIQERSKCHISTSLGGDGLKIKYHSITISMQGDYETRIDKAISSISDLLMDGMDVFVVVDTDLQADRLSFILNERGLSPKPITGSILDYVFAQPEAGGKSLGGGLYVIIGTISSGFILPDAGVAIVAGSLIIGGPRQKRPKAKGIPISDPFGQLNLGDAVVHRDHGIGIFRGVQRLDIEGSKGDFILLEYLGDDKLYIPVYRMSLLQRYIGDQECISIDKLGGLRWSRSKRKARASIERLAKELIEIYAKRASKPGFSFRASSNWLNEFESSFPYEETEDQIKAIEDVYADMGSKNPMDRLICGDVGYGKTEVALRASFIAVMSGKQVALLVPTTLLASQHLATFRARFEPWPVSVEAITSFATSKKNRHVLEELKQGKVDIIIGTHALLSDRVKFNDLGLLIVDEEHRFGVAHKERIKAMRSEIDILTLSATPIPRTLNMALSGIRDLSIIETPPLNRKSIETLILRFDDDIISQAINRELARGGQVFFVHNQVSNMDAMAEYIRTICPGARVGVAHGQMPRKELERVMRDFIERRLNVLVSSAIIGSGIDIATANTIIINRADKFGMADLYQLRGRVGRSKQKGYALLLIPAVGQITDDARKRLSAMKEYESLGAGFHMALRDMEIRGTGEILGSAQWGHIAAIGYELYQQMLKEAVDRLQGKPIRKEIEPEIAIGLDAYIPEEYCPDQHLRLGLYKRLSIADKNDINQIREELLDMYGPIPEPTKTLLEVSEIRDIMKKLRIKKLERTDNKLRLYIRRDTTVSTEKLVRLGQMTSKRESRIYTNGAVEIPINGREILNEIFSIIYSLF